VRREDRAKGDTVGRQKLYEKIGRHLSLVCHRLNCIRWSRDCPCDLLQSYLYLLTDRWTNGPIWRIWALLS